MPSVLCCQLIQLRGQGDVGSSLDRLAAAVETLHLSIQPAPIDEHQVFYLQMVSQGNDKSAHVHIFPDLLSGPFKWLEPSHPRKPCMKISVAQCLTYLKNL